MAFRAVVVVEFLLIDRIGTTGFVLQPGSINAHTNTVW
jgi:hypothetical protein